MAEALLAIFYHIIKGEAVIKEKLGPTPESSSASSSAAASSAAARQPAEPARPQPEINVRHLQQVCLHSLSWFLTSSLNLGTKKACIAIFKSVLNTNSPPLPSNSLPPPLVIIQRLTTTQNKAERKSGGRGLSKSLGSGSLRAEKLVKLFIREMIAINFICRITHYLAHYVSF